MQAYILGLHAGPIEYSHSLLQAVFWKGYANHILTVFNGPFKWPARTNGCYYKRVLKKHAFVRPVQTGSVYRP